MNNTYDAFMKIQMTINQNYNEQIDILNELIVYLINVVEDHEKDMEKMCKEINELKRELSKRRGVC